MGTKTRFNLVLMWPNYNVPKRNFGHNLNTNALGVPAPQVKNHWARAPENVTAHKLFNSIILCGIAWSD